jgi:hypothetical protein
MKFVLTTALGFVAGVALVIAGLYFNPLTEDSGSAEDANARVLAYGSPFVYGLAATHSGRSRLPLRPDSIPELWETTISDAMLSVVVLHNEEGLAVGVGSRVSQFSENTEILTRGIVVDDNWLVTIPGEGSFFVNADSNLWPFLKETFIPVWYLDRPWQGPKLYQPTSGPGLGGKAIVTGASGRFANAQGSAVESYRIHTFPQPGDPGDVEARLYVQLGNGETSLAAELP